MRIRSLAALMVILSLLGGCASSVSTKPYASGRILLLPPRDSVSDGKPHPEGIGSGKLLQEYLQESFKKTPFQLMVTSNHTFNSTAIAPIKNGIIEAKRLKADYVLQLVLGEFHDAGVGTFRPDFAYLDGASMYDVQTGEVVWKYNSPQYLKRPNWGHYHWLLEDHAKAVAESISKNMK